MSFSNIIKKIFGDKSSRDLKAIRPILDKIKQEMPKVAQMDLDQLRAQIDSVRADIAKATANDQEQIDKLRKDVESLPFDKRQPVWDKIDEHEKKILDILEDQLKIGRAHV